MNISDDSKRGQFVRFCINGCVAVAIQYAVYWTLLQMNCEANIAFTIGYVVSFCYNFIVTSYWTFHSRPSWKHLTGFGGSHVVNYLVQIAFLNTFLWLMLPKSIAGVLAMACAVPINFLILKFVYKK